MYRDISPYVVACRYHIGTGVPQAGTVVVAACGEPVPISLNIVLSRYHTGSVAPLPINAGLWLENKRPFKIFKKSPAENGKSID
jgi:hypothetical protein